jgi:uncharacterized alpha-E superfamily protein
MGPTGVAALRTLRIPEAVPAGGGHGAHRGEHVLSRVADSIYWMNRYMERAENTARFIDVNLNLMLDLPPGSNEQWEPLVRTTADLPLFREHYRESTRSNVCEFLSFDPDNPNSIIRCVHAARENARSVRDTISSEMWEQVNTFHLMVRHAAFARNREDYHLFYSRVKHEAHMFAGITDATMSHGEGFHFGRLGRMIERADKTSRLLDVKYFILLPTVSDVGTPYDDLQWSALLKSTSALEMFRKRFGRIQPERVADFLILDREFPRSILFCLERAEDSLRMITGAPMGTFDNDAQQLLGRLCARLRYVRIEEVIRQGLHEFLDGVQRELNAIGDGIHAAFFALRPVGEMPVLRSDGVQVSGMRLR